MNDIKNILLVEDDEDDQIFFSEALLDIANVKLMAIANNGVDALKKLENALILPDMIFMDINMPLMNGTECLIAVTNNPLTQHIPVIILTTDSGSIRLVQQLGAKAFINKPSNGKVLREKIELIINLDFINDSHVADETFQIAF